MRVNRVWGTASGVRGTSDAARGALTWREYPVDAPVQSDDWLQVIKIERDVEGTKKDEHAVESGGPGNKTGRVRQR